MNRLHSKSTLEMFRAHLAIGLISPGMRNSKAAVTIVLHRSTSKSVEPPAKIPPIDLKAFRNLKKSKFVERGDFFDKGASGRSSKGEDDSDERITLFGYLILLIPIGTFALGTWQVKRRQWKLALLEDLDKRTKMEPRELPEDLDEINSMEYTPVKVRGRFLHDKEFTIGPKSLILEGKGASEIQSSGLISRSGRSSNTGYYVITPFKLEDRDLTILVNRGWVPHRFKDASTRKAGLRDEIVEINGIVRTNEVRPPFIPRNAPKDNVWLYRDINAMAEKCGTAPIYIDILAKDSGPSDPIGGQTRVTLRNEHLSYVITWYLLSSITGYMWYRQFIQKLPLL